jgi:hypothetical protein
MDTKLLFLIGVMILILSTCSIDAAPAESGVDGRVNTVTMCSANQAGEGCYIQHKQITVNGHLLE